MDYWYIFSIKYMKNSQISLLKGMLTAMFRKYGKNVRNFRRFWRKGSLYPPFMEMLNFDQNISVGETKLDQYDLMCPFGIIWIYILPTLSFVNQ